MAKINNAQWKKILFEGLALRSCSKEEIENKKLGNASYSINCNCKYPDPIPLDWDDKLKETLRIIINFNNSEDRYLAIVSISRGNENDYPGAFLKSSSQLSEIWAYTQIAKETVDSLSDWVVKNIPEQL